MRQALEATLVLTISALLTLLIMVVVFPRHALGGGGTVAETSDIVPALFVFGVHDRPGTEVSPTAPENLHRSQGARCPYLAALAAASGCPAMQGKCPVFKKKDVSSACPYLEGLRRRSPETPEQPVGPRGLDI